MIKQKTYIFIFLLIPFILMPSAFAQDKAETNGINTTWLILQTIPSCTWTNFPFQTNFAFEWEAAPILYSFGMNKLDPRWHFFKLTPPERFAGSMEFNVSIQLFTSKAGSSHWGFSGQLLAHLPLIESGEYLDLNLGIARYSNALISSNYVVAGFSTLFGFFHYNIKYSPADDIWMHAIEFRFF